jgi:hypothetical protein
MTQSHDDDTWLVQLANGDVRMMTLEQLDDAFQKGDVDESTRVRRDGASKWMTLGEELCMSSESQSATSLSPPPPSPQSSISTHPVVADVPASSPSTDDFDLEASLRSSRRRKWILGTTVASAVVIGLAAVTAVNVSRMRPHAPLAAEIPTTIHVAAPSDPEPEPTTKTDSKDKDKSRRHRNHAVQNAPTPTPDDKPASTVFHTNGDAYDPLNAKL